MLIFKFCYSQYSSLSNNQNYFKKLIYFMLTNFLTYEFMQRAFLAGTLLAIAAPIIGIFMVVRRYSAISDTLSHVALVGVAFGLISGQSPLLVSILVASLAGVLIEIVRENKRIYGESVLVLVMSASLALVSILLSFRGGFGVSLSSFLFGSISTVSSSDIWAAGGILALVLGSVFWLYKPMLKTVFDENLAKISGTNTVFIRLWLVFLASLVVSSGIQIVGGLLVSSLVVIPVITALQYSLGFKNSLFLSVVFSVLSVWLGLILAYYQNLPSGGSIVVVSISFFVLSFLANWKK